MIISIGQLVAGTLFFGINFCEYYRNPKINIKSKMFLRNIYIQLFRKGLKLKHSNKCIHLDEKVSPPFMVQKNHIKKATVSQW